MSSKTQIGTAAAHLLRDETLLQAFSAVREQYTDIALNAATPAQAFHGAQGVQALNAVVAMLRAYIAEGEAEAKRIAAHNADLLSKRNQETRRQRRHVNATRALDDWYAEHGEAVQ